MGRLKELDYATASPAQKRVYDDILASPRKRIAGPMNAWLRIPKLADLSQKLGAFVRFETKMPARLREFVILIIARHFDAQVEWWAHHPPAIEAGLDPAIAEAIRQRKAPTFVNEDEAILYAFVTEVIATKRVSDDIYARALALLGEEGVVELVAIMGNYYSVALVLNIFEVEPPDGSAPLSA